ncbi:MAG: flagellar basal body rod protein FlgC [Caulobacteraceae bacterium]|nr:flagellar basal body rod protein FlgC [Caulobacteraceae bacterium]
MQAMDISRTGLDVEWRRMEVVAENIANASTVRTATGAPYRAMRLVSGPKGRFADYLAAGGVDGRLQGVDVYGVEPIDLPPRRVHEPQNPQADADGYVTYPGFDHAAEMTLMIKTSRAYEANIVAMNAARQMYIRAMDLGKKS